MNARLATLRNALEPILPVQLVPFVTSAPIRSRTNSIFTGFPTINLTNPAILVLSVTLVTPTNPRPFTNSINATLRTVRFATTFNHPVQIIADANPRGNALSVGAILIAHWNAFSVEVQRVSGIALAHFRCDAAAMRGAAGSADGKALVLGRQLEAIVAGTCVGGETTVAGPIADGFADERGGRGEGVAFLTPAYIRLHTLPVLAGLVTLRHTLLIPRIFLHFRRISLVTPALILLAPP